MVAPHTVINQRPPRPGAVALLEREHLPASDLTDQHWEHFFFAGPPSEPTGLIGLEIYQKEALLRSLVVSASARKAGIGTALVEHAEEHARSQGVRFLYLLTTTAEAFFTRRGYVRFDRAEAPASIQTTREFASLCPASSAFMFKPLYPKW